MLHHPITVLSAAFLAFTAFAPGLQAPSASSKAPPAPQAVLEGAGAEPVRVPLSELDTDDPRKLGGNLLSFEGLTTPIDTRAANDLCVLELVGGQRLIGSVTRGDAESLAVELVGGVQLAVTLDELSSLSFPARIPSSWSQPLVRAEEGDRLYRRQGNLLERIDGGTEEFGASGVRFHGQLVGSLSIEWSDVVALFIDNLGADEKPKSERVQVLVDLFDGSRLRGGLVRVAPDGCRIVAVREQELVLPLASVALVLVDDGRFAFLSSLKPVALEKSLPFGDELGMSWTPRMDQSVMGTTLLSMGRAFSRGIGVHAPSRLSWKLDQPYARLRGSVAIDDDVLSLGARGSVVFRISGNGKRLFESAVVRGGDAAVPFQVDLSGVDELTLEVDVADKSFVADRADWLQMLLVKPQ